MTPISGQLIDDLRSAVRVAGGTGVWVLVGGSEWTAALTGLVGFPGVRVMISDVPYDFATDVLDAIVTAPAYDIRGLVLGLSPETWTRARLLHPFLRLGAMTVFEHPGKHDPALADQD